MADIYICYQTDDTGLWARVIATGLASRHIDVFYDQERIGAGENFPEQIVQKLQECSAVLAVVGESWTRENPVTQDRGLTPWVRKELSWALNGGGKQKVLLIPVLIEGAKLPDIRTLDEESAIIVKELSRRKPVRLDLPRLELCINELAVALENELYAARNGSKNLERLMADAREKFNLKEIVLVSSVKNVDDRYRTLGKKAADFFRDQVDNDTRVGISCGRSINWMAQMLDGAERSLTLLPISFNASLLPDGVPVANTILEICKRIKGARGVDVPLPAFFSSEAERRLIGSRNDIKEYQEQLRTLDCAFFSVGSLERTSSYDVAVNNIKKIIPEFDRQFLNLRKTGAIGEINWHPFDAYGTAVEHDLIKHIASLDLGALKELAADYNKDIVLVGGGNRKERAILGALRGGMQNVLITDTDTFGKIMELEHEECR